jgi:hypothetical protein
MLVEFVESPLGYLKAIFEFKPLRDEAGNQSRKLRITLDISWSDNEIPSRAELSELRRIIENSRYGLLEPSHCVDCYWQQIMAVMARCHDQARQFSKHILTNVHIEEVMRGAPGEDNISKLLARQLKVKSFAVSH